MPSEPAAPTLQRLFAVKATCARFTETIPLPPSRKESLLALVWEALRLYDSLHLTHPQVCQELSAKICLLLTSHFADSTITLASSLTENLEGKVNHILFSYLGIFTELVIRIRAGTDLPNTLKLIASATDSFRIFQKEFEEMLRFQGIVTIFNPEALRTYQAFFNELSHVLSLMVDINPKNRPHMPSPPPTGTFNPPSTSTPLPTNSTRPTANASQTALYRTPSGLPNTSPTPTVGASSLLQTPTRPAP